MDPHQLVRSMTGSGLGLKGQCNLEVIQSWSAPVHPQHGDPVAAFLQRRSDRAHRIQHRLQTVVGTAVMGITNPEAEAAFIHSLIVNPEQAMDVADLQPEDFSSREYANAYSTILEMLAHDKPVDILTLKSEGITVEAYEVAGQHAPATEYASMIRDAAYRRKVVNAAGEIAHAAEVGGEAAVVAAVEDAMEVVRERKHDGSEIGMLDLSQFRLGPPPPFLGWVAPEGTTILYGDGGDGKGWIAASAIRGLLQQGIKSAILDFENHPTEWAYRLDKLGVPLHDVVYIQPGGTMVHWADAKAAAMLHEAGVQFLVVDSATYASNPDDPYSPQTAMNYKQARLRLGNLPTMLLAHTSKSSNNSIYGSVFWRNEARLTWNLKRDYSSGQRSVTCMKANAYPDLEGKVKVIEFDEKIGVLNLHDQGSVWVPQTQPNPTRPPKFTW